MLRGAGFFCAAGAFGARSAEEGAAAVDVLLTGFSFIGMVEQILSKTGLSLSRQGEYSKVLRSSRFHSLWYP